MSSCSNHLNLNYFINWINCWNGIGWKRKKWIKSKKKKKKKKKGEVTWPGTCRGCQRIKEKKEEREWERGRIKGEGERKTDHVTDPFRWLDQPYAWGQQCPISVVLCSSSRTDVSRLAPRARCDFICILFAPLICIRWFYLFWCLLFSAVLKGYIMDYPVC